MFVCEKGKENVEGVQEKEGRESERRTGKDGNSEKMQKGETVRACVRRTRRKREEDNAEISFVRRRH